MCRSIKTLRPPFTPDVSQADIEAAALQYVRKISGFRKPSARNTAAFEAAVTEIAKTTRTLLNELDIQGVTRM
jgi:hypothetical protein